MSLLDYTAVELAAKIKAGETTATEAMEAVIAQIEKSEDELNCYVTFDKEKALAAAKKADEDIKAGKLTGPLAGVPFAIKDNMCTEGMLTTCSSKILGNFVPTYTADAVVRLENAGAVIIGKTNTTLSNQCRIPTIQFNDFHIFCKETKRKTDRIRQ